MVALMPVLQETPAFDGMAVDDDVDRFVEMCNVSFGTGVGSGCQVTQHAAGANMSVDIAAGKVFIAGVQYPFAGASGLTIAAASAGDRRDTVVLRAAFGVISAFVCQGTVPSGLTGAWTQTTPLATCKPPMKGPMVYSASATPQSAVDANTDVVLAEVYVPFNAASITGTLASIISPTTGNIVDKTQVFVAAGTNRWMTRIPVLAPVQAIALSNISISSAPSTVDGWPLVTSGSDSILLIGQTTASQNGIWTWNGAGSPLTRQADFPAGGILTTGRTVLVMNGFHAAGQWELAVPSSGLTIDTSAQVWTPSRPAPQAYTEGQDITARPASILAGTILTTPVVQAVIGAASIGATASAATTITLEPGTVFPPNPNGPTYTQTGGGGTVSITVPTSGTAAVYTISGSHGNVLTVSFVSGSGTIGAGLGSIGYSLGATYTGPLFDLSWGDSFMEGVGGVFGSTDWLTNLSTMENNLAGLPAPGQGLIMPFGGPGSIYGTFQWNNTGAGSAVTTGAFVPGAGQASPGTVGFASSVKLTGTAAAGDTSQTFRRVMVFWLAQPNGEKVTVATTGNVISSTAIDTHIQTASVTVTIGSPSLTVASGGFPGAAVGDTVTIYSGSGTLPANTTILEINNNTLTLSANATGNGTATIAYQGIRCFDSTDLGVATLGTGFTATCSAHSVGTGAAGLVLLGSIYMNTAGTSGSLMLNQGSGSTQTGDWATTGSFSAGAYNFLRFLVNAGMTPRRILLGLGLADQPGFYLNTNTPTTMAANLTNIVQAIQAITTQSEIVLVAEHMAGNASILAVGPNAWANSWIPAIRNVAIANGCSFVDEFARFGNLSYQRQVTDGVTTAGSTTLTSATAAFVSSDNGAFAIGAGIAPGTTIIVVNGTTATLSMPATITATGVQLIIGGDFFGLTEDNGLHVGTNLTSASRKNGQRAIAEFFYQKLSYSQANLAGGQSTQAFAAVVVNGLTGATTSVRFVGGTAGGAPTTGTFSAGDVAVTTTGQILVCITGGSPGTWCRANNRDQLITSSFGTPTYNVDRLDVLTITGINTTITNMSTNQTGTPVEGQKLLVKLTGTGTQNITTWGSKFASGVGVTLPTTGAVTTTVSTLGFVWDAVSSVFRLVGIA